MIQAVSRFLLLVAGLLGGYAVTQVIDWQAQLGLTPSYVILLFIILGGASGYLLGGIIGRELTSAWHRAEIRISEISTVDILLATVGLVVGLLVAFFAAQPLRLLKPTSLAVFASVLLTLLCAYAGMSVSLTRRREAIGLFPQLAPNDERDRRERLVALDTSAVIDGRFVELRRLGFMPGDIRVPRFVLAELQTLADSADDAKRSRGRRGLDLLLTLTDEDATPVMEVDYSDLSMVDEKLMRLGVEAKAIVATVDYNLTKVARVRGIEVVNLNEAAAALRPNFLPGDSIHIQVTRAGKENGQGVGYLEDGTMVVVQEGRDLIGSEADVEVSSVLQTSGGRMIFARASSDAGADAALDLEAGEPA